ncbi:hypothetical protein Ping_1696 [Psychromonas ingrahamii 37]|uniref:Uncharacterized protein n=1 Tax=Psychromonas ingrahamii (strain DSM 17664 / CCUG 51855 / 37) TaxID=357804 RepID=A1SVH0_PSYIN|nr:hypothetical protein [Psychromonas ingrahamii]ABM03485.1 hypothetical protein Ping_1696 [Psychromonas ingrahamii 37]
MAFFSELLKTEHILFVWVIVAFIAFSGFLVSIKGFFEFIAWVKKVRLERSSDLDLAKRSTFKSIIALALLGAAWSSGSTLYRSYLDGKKILFVKFNKNLIVNKKTGIIHLKNVSAGVLPSSKWAGNKLDLVKHRPYSESSRRIYEQIAIEALKQKNDTVAIEAYILAIQVSPLSYHLYDNLIRIYGRQKEYSKINLLFNDALENLSKLNLGKRQKKNANKEFLMRLKRTEHRALLA